MKYLALTTMLAFASAPAFANIGDVEGQIQAVKTEVVFVSQPLLTADRELAAANSCVLPFTHIVSVPETFVPVDGTEVACLAE